MRKTNQKNKEQFNQVLDETFGEVSVDLSRRQHPMNSQPNEEDPVPVESLPGARIAAWHCWPSTSIGNGPNRV